jgi:phosphoribosylformylglycinamidine cyclo-ligase
VLDVRKLRGIPRLEELIGHLAAGYVAAAKEADVTIVDGETAELGDRVQGYGEFNYNWSATALWIAHEKRIIDDTKIRPGDAVVALKEHGFRSNGLSLVRRAFTHIDPEWHDVPFDSPDAEQDRGVTLGELVLRPSIPYSKLVVDMTGGYDLEREPKVEIHGAAHITGGGIPEKLGRVLRNTGLGAVLHNLYDPPEAMRFALQTQQDIEPLSDEGAYRTLNMGQGMLVITPEPDRVIAVANEHGKEADVAGEIVKDPSIELRSRGLERPEWLSYRAG